MISMVGGSLNAYWVRLAEYTFVSGPHGSGTVTQSYWIWYQSSFDGTAKNNKIRTGYRTSGCAAACDVRTPRGFQPGKGPMSRVVGRYSFDRHRRLVVEWPGRHTEVWTVRTAAKLSRITLHHTDLGGLYGDGYGSTASFRRRVLETEQVRRPERRDDRKIGQRTLGGPVRRLIGQRDQREPVREQPVVFGGEHREILPHGQRATQRTDPPDRLGTRAHRPPVQYAGLG